jgi:hypothetical protein
MPCVHGPRRTAFNSWRLDTSRRGTAKATHEAMSAMRVMANTIATGEAAGVAMALAQQHDLIPSEVDTQALRDELRRAGAWLPNKEI